MSDESVENILIELTVDEKQLQINLNYIKTLWLLNKEPELEEVVKLLEYSLQACIVQKAKMDQAYAEMQNNQWRENEKHAMDQQIAENKRAMQQAAMPHMRPNQWASTSISNTPTGGSTSRGNDPLLKGTFDPPF